MSKPRIYRRITRPLVPAEVYVIGPSVTQRATQPVAVLAISLAVITVLVALFQ